ncbi:MAG: hypothetical protein IT453_13665 [Planctomycetes bacterium]|nr:hypothetical protein [Planctomycetota bacterium]
MHQVAMFAPPGKPFTSAVLVAAGPRTEVLSVGVDVSENVPHGPNRIEAQNAGGKLWEVQLPDTNALLPENSTIYFHWSVKYRTWTGQTKVRRWPEDRNVELHGVALPGPDLIAPADGSIDVGTPLVTDPTKVLVSLDTTVPSNEIHFTVRVEDLAAQTVEWYPSARWVALPRGRMYRWTVFFGQQYHPPTAPSGGVWYAYVPARQTWTFATHH